MGRNSPSARKHRALVFLAHLEQYKRLGPLVGPKEPHQPDYYRWPDEPSVQCYRCQGWGDYDPCLQCANTREAKA